MRLTAISAFLLILLPLTSAIDFTINYQDSVDINESFSVSISAATSDNYDVKVFIQNNETKSIISEIYNDGWKNPYYYIKSAFPETSSFTVHVKNYSSTAAACVRMRKVGTSSYTERCGAITISNAVAEEIPPAKEEKMPENETKIVQTSKINEEFVPAANISPQIPQPEQPASPERIVLNQKSPAKDYFISKEEKLRLFAVYSFTGLTIVIIIFLAMKKF
jgi:hypothetical protein